MLAHLERQNASQWYLRVSSRLQNVLQFRLLVGRQACRELDVHANDKVAPLVWLLALRHTKARESVDVLWAGGT